MAEVNNCATCKHLQQSPQYCVKVFRPVHRPMREGCAGWVARVDDADQPDRA